MGAYAQRFATIFCAVVAMAASLASAQVRVDGSLLVGDPNGFFLRQVFTCYGTPTCTGIFTVTERDSGCSNSFTFTGTITITGFDLSHAGTSFAGSGTQSIDSSSNINADGTCSYSTHPQTNPPATYTGTWDGTHGTFTFTFDEGGGNSHMVTGTFTSNAAPPPVFPMTITANVTPATASATATVQPRPQDAGTTQNIYVFTHAPANLVSGIPGAKKVGTQPPIAAAHDDAIICVLAQVTADGHLVAATPSTMQAYLTGVISSQGQAVQLLNNVATPSVAGATVFVGYGASAQAMLSSGVYQDAVSIPGPVQCTASLASAPAPKSPAPLTGLWWNPSESGWGIHFTQRGDNLFAAWYTYDSAGNPKWYVAPNCVFASANATSGSCSSSLYEVDGPTFFGTAFHSPTPDQVKNAGTLQLTFQDTSNASLTYTVGTFTRTVPIVRQVFPVAQSPTPAVDYTDLWWNPSESGWGMAITHQFGNIFLAWYVYDANGKPFWYVAPACTVSGSSCSGTLYRTTGPAFGPPLDPSKVKATAVGSAIVSFVDANNAVLSYTVDNVQATKTLTRQLF